MFTNIYLNNIKNVATVLTVYGIETICGLDSFVDVLDEVATVLTVYGIETYCYVCSIITKWKVALQQFLPFTVLKRNLNDSE